MPDTVRTMITPRVYSVVDARTKMSECVNKAKAGETVYIGKYRRPEVVLISVERLAELEAGEQGGHE